MTTIPDAPARDFRSDTVTRPGPAMREAMAQAEVGDDVFGDDPTVRRLEAQVAELLGKAAAVFLPSGTMANLVAFCVHARPGEEALVEARSHTFHYEQAGAARFAGVQLRPLPGDERGGLSPEEVTAAIRARPGDPLGAQLHCPRTALCVIENTHNFTGGRVVPLAQVRALGERCRARGVRVHLDGARLMNAVVASGVPAAAWAAPCDSVYIALSKGLGAPAGSVLAGDEAFCFEARRVRKALGGGMRQSGILAAAGLLAMTDGVARLGEDHRNARALAEGLSTVPGLAVDPGAVETNIVFIKHERGRRAEASLVDALAQAGIGCVAVGEHGVRFVTHLDVSREDVDAVIAAAAAWSAGGGGSA
jgi:threonine aldolase